MKGKSKTLTWGTRIVLTLSVMAGLVYGVLSLAERNPDPIRLGLEDYFEKLTNADAQITDMTKTELVPVTAFGMRGMQIVSRGDKPSTLVTAKDIYVSLPFLTLLSGAGGYYAIQAKGLEIASGFLLPKKISLEFAGISDPTPQEGKPAFMLEGNYNNLPLLITAGMERKAGRKFYSYRFADEYPVTFKLGTLEGDGIYERRGDAGVFKKVQMVRGPHRVDFVLRNIAFGEETPEAEGSINGVEFTGRLDRSGETPVFLIEPLYMKPDDDKRVSNFVKIFNDDLGYDKDPLLVVVPARKDKETHNAKQEK